METGTSKTPWKVIFWRFGAWGLGFGLGIGIVLVVSVWFIERPKSWSRRELVAHNAKAEGIGHIKIDGSSFDVDGIGTSFSFDIQNATSEDITLTKDVRVMQSGKTSGALADSSLTLPKEYFLPAKHTVAVTLQNASACNKDMKPADCFNSLYKDVGEIVIFDEPGKREIRFAIPPITTGKDGAPVFYSSQ